MRIEQVKSSLALLFYLLQHPICFSKVFILESWIHVVSCISQLEFICLKLCPNILSNLSKANFYKNFLSFSETKFFLLLLFICFSCSHLMSKKIYKSIPMLTVLGHHLKFSKSYFTVAWMQDSFPVLCTSYLFFYSILPYFGYTRLAENLLLV